MELSYKLQDFHAPQATVGLIKRPLAIILVGDLEVTVGGFGEGEGEANMELESTAKEVAEAVFEEEESSTGKDIEEFIHLVG